MNTKARFRLVGVVVILGAGLGASGWYLVSTGAHAAAELGSVFPELMLELVPGEWQDASGLVAEYEGQPIVSIDRKKAVTILSAPDQEAMVYVGAWIAGVDSMAFIRGDEIVGIAESAADGIFRLTRRQPGDSLMLGAILVGEAYSIPLY